MSSINASAPARALVSVTALGEQRGARAHRKGSLTNPDGPGSTGERGQGAAQASATVQNLFHRLFSSVARIIGVPVIASMPAADSASVAAAEQTAPAQTAQMPAAQGIHMTA